MKIRVVFLLAIVSFASAEYVQEVLGNTAYGYLKNIGIPVGDRIRQAEEAYLSQQIIVGGLPTNAEQYPSYQAGLLSSIVGLDGIGICGGSLISNTRVLTAAHCWFDGINQARRFTVVLGSVLLFSGGQRIDSSAVAVHPNWLPLLARNDVAIVNLPNAVAISATIAPIALPSDAELNEDFVGESAIATGFGIMSDNGQIAANQSLSQVRLNIIANNACILAFPLYFQPTNICTSGVGGVGTCRGDSGGSLTVERNGRPFLVGVTSFGSPLGCESAMPVSYTRVTSFISFINQNI